MRIWDISGLRLCDNISLTPEPYYPARLDGQVWFEDDSGDGVLSSGERGRFRLTVSNSGMEAAFNIVTLAIPDTLPDGLEIVTPGLVPMLLPGKSVKKSVAVHNKGSEIVQDVIFTFRILESNGFHVNPPLKSAIVRTRPE